MSDWDAMLGTYGRCGRFSGRTGAEEDAYYAFFGGGGARDRSGRVPRALRDGPPRAARRGERAGRALARSVLWLARWTRGAARMAHDR